MEKELYLLRQESKGHEKGIRTLCILNGIEGSDKIVTAGYDGLVIIWKRKDEDIYEPESMLTDHIGVVYCLCNGPENTRSFFSGGQDKKISWMNIQGQTLKTFTGHTGVVSSVSLSRINHKNVLLSGSWDATAKIWDLDTGSCLHTLGNHKYGVSVSSWVRPKQSSDLVITGSQDGILHIWDNDINQLSGPVKSFPGYHLDIIRGFSFLNCPVTTDTTILLSCSNDGTFRSLNLINYEISEPVVASNSFIFDVSSYRNHSTGEQFVCTASEDGNLDLWDFGSRQNLQTISHASTIWKIGILSNGDLVTACEDGFLRIWTTDETKAAPIDQREKQRNQALQSHQAAEGQRTGSSINVDNLPDVSQIATLRGKKAGQHKLFRDHHKALVYLWNGNTWEYVDEVASEQRNQAGGSLMGKYFEGDDYFAPGEYDYIFDAEIGNDGRMRTIPFRVGDNTLVVAEKFCAREEISKAHVPQIEEFIKQNTTRSISKVQLSQQPLTPATDSSSSLKSRHFPPPNYLSFKTYHANKLKQKLLEFNNELNEESLKLSEMEKSYLDEMIEKLNQPHLAAEHFRLCEMDLAFNSRLSSWPPSKIFPVIDLWRIMAIHPQSTDLHKKSDGGWHFIALAIRLSKIEFDDSQVQLSLCCMRYLCNLFEHPTNRNAMLKYSSQILESLPRFPIDKEMRQARIAEASIFVNISMAFGQSGHSLTLETAEYILRSIFAHLERETDEGVRLYLLVAIGTLLSFLSPSKRIAIAELCRALKIQFESNPSDNELKSCERDVVAFLMY